jgi:hypothetical protein
MTKRNLLAELTEGLQALADARKGKRTLRTNGSERSKSLCADFELRSEGAAKLPFRDKKLSI